MKHETYLEIMRERLGMPGATHEELEAEAQRQMEAAGCRVRLDRMPDHRFRVRVRKLDGRRTSYNIHTTSTSGYPILTAWEKWYEHTRKQVTS